MSQNNRRKYLPVPVRTGGASGALKIRLLPDVRVSVMMRLRERFPYKDFL